MGQLCSLSHLPNAWAPGLKTELASTPPQILPVCLTLSLGQEDEGKSPPPTPPCFQLPLFLLPKSPGCTPVANNRPPNPSWCQRELGRGREHRGWAWRAVGECLGAEPLRGPRPSPPSWSLYPSQQQFPGIPLSHFRSCSCNQSENSKCHSPL